MIWGWFGEHLSLSLKNKQTNKQTNKPNQNKTTHKQKQTNKQTNKQKKNTVGMSDVILNIERFWTMSVSSSFV